jgi:hypothetical protein
MIALVMIMRDVLGPVMRGSRTLNVVLSGSGELTAMSPWWAVTTPCVIIAVISSASGC